VGKRADSKIRLTRNHPVGIDGKERTSGGSSALLRTLIHALLEREQLLRTEGLVVDLRGRLDEVLEMRAREEIAEVHKLAVLLVLDVDDAPAVCARGRTCRRLLRWFRSRRWRKGLCA